MNKNIRNVVGVLLGLIIINFLASKVYHRFDLTKDKRYTLSNTSKDLIKDIDAPLIIDMFLEGDFPSEFRLLRSETKQILEEFSLESNQILINYINPIEDEATRQLNIDELTKENEQPKWRII